MATSVLCPYPCCLYMSMPMSMFMSMSMVMFMSMSMSMSMATSIQCPYPAVCTCPCPCCMSTSRSMQHFLAAFLCPIRMFMFWRKFNTDLSKANLSAFFIFYSFDTTFINESRFFTKKFERDFRASPTWRFLNIQKSVAPLPTFVLSSCTVSLSFLRLSLRADLLFSALTFSILFVLINILFLHSRKPFRIVFFWNFPSLSFFLCYFPKIFLLHILF